MEKDKEKQETYGVCRALISAPQNEDYDFGCVAVPTDNMILKYNPTKKEYFYQVLLTGRENVVTDRMDSGLPIFDRHPEPEDQLATSVLGITIGYDFTEEGIFFMCKHGARADEALKEDVKNGVIKTVSIEGTVLEYREDRSGTIPTYYATLWEPECLGYAPVPNDVAAQIEVKRALARQIEKSNTKPSFFNSLTKNIKK